MSKGNSRDSVHFASLLDAAGLIESGQLSPVDLTRSMLDRIEAVDGRLKSYATVMADCAIEAARKAEQEIAGGTYRGPLHGMPIAVKDLCFTKGSRTMGGTGVFKDFVPTYDGTVVSAVATCGCRPARQAEPDRRGDGRLSPGLRDPRQSMELGLLVGRVLQRLRRRDRGRTMLCLDRDRYGRIDSFPCHGKRDRGTETNRRPCQPLWCFDACRSPWTTLAPWHAEWPMPPWCCKPSPAGTSMTRRPCAIRVPTCWPPSCGPACAACDSALTDDSARGSDPRLIAAIEDALAIWTRLGAEVVDIEMPEGAGGLREAWFAICAAEASKAHSRTFPSRAAEYGPYFCVFLALARPSPATSMRRPAMCVEASAKRFMRHWRWSMR